MALRLLEDVPKPGRILDIGCGSHPFFLLSCDFAERHGIDQVAADGETLIDGVRVVQHDVVEDPRLPFADSHFDAATMLAVFEHIQPPALVPLLSEIRRVLTPGGRLVLTTPAGWTDPILRTLAFFRLVSPEEIHEHKDAYDRSTVRRFLEAAGFEPEHLALGSFELGMNLWATATP
jgi:SAM-dependent methyltransferase